MASEASIHFLLVNVQSTNRSVATVIAAIPIADGISVLLVSRPNCFEQYLDGRQIRKSVGASRNQLISGLHAGSLQH